ncbi:MAG TPA: BrnT family toxin [Rhodothermia bacterium]|nr:BrnT family toxin [Rhodothermia bacterium]
MPVLYTDVSVFYTRFRRHAMDPAECEQAFFIEPFVVAVDEQHSGREHRWRALGQTVAGRKLFLAFTMRGSLIRVIAARDMNRKERKHYEEIAAAWILFASRRSMTLEGNLRSGIVTVLRFPTERFGPL